MLSREGTSSKNYEIMHLPFSATQVAPVSYYMYMYSNLRCVDPRKKLQRRMKVYLKKCNFEGSQS